MGGARFIRAGVLACILMLAIQLPTTAQESGIDFVVEPASGSETPVDGGYFLLAARPGQSLEQSLALRNDSNRRLFLRLAAVDATTGPYGGVSYGLGSESPSRMGTWIALDETSINLGPGDSEFVTFKIDIPRDAPSGENLAGISVWSPAGTAARGDGAAGQAGAEISIQTRRIVAVQVNLPGPSRPELVISGIQPSARPDGLYLEIDVANAGFGLTQGKGVVDIPREGFEKHFDVDTFVPGTAIAYPVRWADSAPEGRYDATAEIDYGGRTATWSGSFTVGSDVLEELAQRGIDTEEAARFPWWIAVLAMTSVGIASVLVVRRRRSTLAARAHTVPETRETPRPPAAPPVPLARRLPPPPPPPSSQGLGRRSGEKT